MCAAECRITPNAAGSFSVSSFNCTLSPSGNGAIKSTILPFTSAARHAAASR